MTNAATGALLGIAVLCAWLGCAGFARLRGPLDRLHCVTFVAVTAGTALTVAAWITDGASIRAGKMLFLLVILLVSGAAMTHAIGRALVSRAADGEEG